VYAAGGALSSAAPPRVSTRVYQATEHTPLHSGVPDYTPPHEAVMRWKPRFFSIWTGQAVSRVGTSLVQFALVWWLTETTGSATVLTTATLVSTIPMIALGPFAGVLVDRWSRRWVMIVSDALIALFTAALAYLFWRGIAEVWHVYVVLFLRTCGGVFQFPAMRAATSLIAPSTSLRASEG